MGRRKRQTFLEETQPAVSAAAPEIIQWETAIYARLSVENSKKDDGGASIEEQVAICREYIDELHCIAFERVKAARKAR